MMSARLSGLVTTPLFVFSAHGIVYGVNRCV